MPSEKCFIPQKLCFATLLTGTDSFIRMVVTCPGVPSEGSAEDGLLSGFKTRNKCGHPKCRSEEMDLLHRTCFAAAGKCEENQHPSMKLTGFLSALPGQILLLSPSMKALSEFSRWLCSFLDKWLLTFKS